jgi:PhzF family phenazine biosynthesis protein
MAKTGALRYAIFDVFTNQKFTGNQLAIIHLPGSDLLSQEEKQNVATEFNFSESVFVHPREDSSKEYTWTINIHTTTEELPFAGHPVIGTACYLLGGVAAKDGEKSITGAFYTKAGRIDLEYDVPMKNVKAAVPHNVRIHSKAYGRSELERLQPSIGFYPETSPVVSIVKGMTFVLIGLDLQDALTFVNTTPYPTQVELDEGWGDSFAGCYFYFRQASRDRNTVRLRTRMIEGSLEDAATGSAACTLAAYLTLQEAKPGQTVRYEITQGVEMGRKSEIFVEAKLGEDGKIETVHLSGSAVQVMEGNLFL